jgi:hypothetical protein
MASTTQAPSRVATTVISLTLMLAAFFVALRWGSACGYSWAENTDPSPGHGCGIVHAQAHWAVVLLPALTAFAAPRGAKAYGAACVAVGLALVAINLLLAS